MYSGQTISYLGVYIIVRGFVSSFQFLVGVRDCFDDFLVSRVREYLLQQLGKHLKLGRFLEKYITVLDERQVSYIIPTQYNWNDAAILLAVCSYLQESELGKNMMEPRLLTLRFNKASNLVSQFIRRCLIMYLADLVYVGNSKLVDIVLSKYFRPKDNDCIDAVVVIATGGEETKLVVENIADRIGILV